MTGGAAAAVLVAHAFRLGVGRGGWAFCARRRFVPCSRTHTCGLAASSLHTYRTTTCRLRTYRAPRTPLLRLAACAARGAGGALCACLPETYLPPSFLFYAQCLLRKGRTRTARDAVYLLLAAALLFSLSVCRQCSSRLIFRMPLWWRRISTCNDALHAVSAFCTSRLPKLAHSCKNIFAFTLPPSQRRFDGPPTTVAGRWRAWRICWRRANAAGHGWMPSCGRFGFLWRFAPSAHA